VNPLSSIVLDPNIVYFALVFGLWVAVTAAYIPGTGVVEGLALLILGVALVVLFNMPTNWAGALLLMIGVLTFLLVPFLNERWARLAEGGLILQVIGALTLFNGLHVSWLLIAVTIALSLAYHRFALLPILTRSRHSAVVIDDDGQLVGAYGRVVRPTEPFGSSFKCTVSIRGEQWTAFSEHPLETGDEVLVIARDGLQLTVEGLKHKHTTRPQPQVEEQP
jgi:membrane-bound ClpP family serine protease